MRSDTVHRFYAAGPAFIHSYVPVYVPVSVNMQNKMRKKTAQYRHDSAHHTRAALCPRPCWPCRIPVMVVCKVDELARTPQRLRNAGVCQPDCLTLQWLRDKVLDVEFEDSSSKPRMSGCRFSNPC
jgi:hypothetical protein